MNSRILLAALCAAAAVSARAHPVSYKGGASVMAWNQSEATDWVSIYSFARVSAVAARYLRFDTEAGELKFYGAQFNHRLKRWNGDGYQANVYLYAGAGGQRLETRDGAAALGGVEADHESRRHLLAVKGLALANGEGPNFYAWEGRVGLAPYKAEFDEPAGWFILAMQHNPQMERHWSLIPMLRVFYRNVLGEVGADHRGDAVVNFMVHF